MRIFIFFFFCCLLNIYAFSQDSLRHLANYKPETGMNVLKTNPAAIVWSQVPFTGEIRLLYERVNCRTESSVLGISFIVPSIFAVHTIRKWEHQWKVNFKLTGYRIQVAQKFYLPFLNWRDAPRGLYLAPHASFYSAKLYVKGVRDRYLQANFVNFSLLIGYQKIFWRLIAVDVYAGLGYRYNYFREGDNQNPIPINMGVEEMGIPDWLKMSFSTNFGVVF